MPKMNYRAADTRIMIVVVIVATLCYPTMIDTAMVVKTEILDQHLQNVILHGPTNTRVLRSTEGTEDVQNRNCYNSPCAWEVYNPRTRISEYIMENQCKCPDSTYKCVRSQDVLQSGAYQYRCRQNTTKEDVEYPKNAN